jgi:hypothetical protein
VATNTIPVSPSLDHRILFTLPSKSGIGPANSLQRIFDDISGLYGVTGDDSVDYRLAAPSPGLLNMPYGIGQFSAQPLSVAMPVDACDPIQPSPSPGTDPTEPFDSSPTPTEEGASGVGTGDGTTVGEQPVVLPNDGLAVPQITELLPNPASPQTDAADEFIELYNPNDAPYDISGFVLEAGGATMRRYVLPEGSVLQPYEYRVLLSSDTSLSLPNSGGSARLLNTSGTVIMQTDTYDTAPDGQAWMADNTGWRWTTAPTPHAVNTFVGLLAAAKKAPSTPAKQATKKTAAVKAASTTKSKTKATAAAKEKKPKTVATKAQLSTVSATARNPVHTGVLAAIGVFALLYGAYEYRHDMANKIHQFRSNRATRRAARQTIARR